MSTPLTPADASTYPAEDRTPTTAFDAAVGFALDKGIDYAMPIVVKALTDHKIDAATAEQKAVNVTASLRNLIFDAIDIGGDIKAAQKLAKAAAAK